MRRLQISIDDPLDATLQHEAARRGISKAALIRETLARELAPPRDPPEDPWRALDGWLSDGGVDDIDQEIYTP